MQLHTGAAHRVAHAASMGAWLLYGLGTENQDLPGYVTINPPPNFGGAVNYGSAFPPRPFPGDADQRHRLPAEPQGADRRHAGSSASKST